MERATESEKAVAAQASFFVFGQDVRLAGARTAWGSMPKSVIDGEIPQGPIPVRLDDPLGRGDSEPSGGSSKLGDIVSGAFSLYSPRLQRALTDFGIALDFKPVRVFAPGRKEPVDGYAWARGVPSVQLSVDALEFFTVQPEQAGGHALFDASVNYRSARVVDARLKAHLEAANLEGVYFVPTEKFGGRLAMVLTMG